jgi:pectate lyase
MKAVQRLGCIAALLACSLPAFALDAALQTAPADGWGAGTVGGSAATPEHIYTVRNRAELLNALTNAGNLPKIIKVAGTIDMTEGTPFASTADQKVRARVRLTSNTTLIGEGPGAGFVNAWIDITSVSQVIVRNLHIVAPCDVGPIWDPTDGSLGNWNSAFDAIGIVTATQVWIDRNTLTDAPVTDDTLPIENGKTKQCHDGAIDITKGADLITVSYNVVTAHDKTMLIGGSDSLTSDAGKLRVTIANNVFNGVSQRVPRVRFGQVHVFNNYFAGSKTANPIRTATASAWARRATCCRMPTSSPLTARPAATASSSTPAPTTPACSRTAGPRSTARRSPPAPCYRARPSRRAMPSSRGRRSWPRPTRWHRPAPAS